MTSEIRSRYKALCFRLIEARYAYYVLGIGLMSDSEYDDLDDRVRQLEEQYPDLIHPESPTRTVGADADRAYPPWMRERVETLLRAQGKATDIYDTQKKENE